MVKFFPIKVLTSPICIFSWGNTRSLEQTNILSTNTHCLWEWTILSANTYSLRQTTIPSGNTHSLRQTKILSDYTFPQTDKDSFSIHTFPRTNTHSFFQMFQLAQSITFKWEAVVRSSVTRSCLRQMSFLITGSLVTITNQCTKHAELRLPIASGRAVQNILKTTDI